MNEATYFLAVLVRKEILTMDEATRLQKGLTEGYINSNLSQMLSKVDKALAIETPALEVVDAKSIIN